MTDQPDEPFGHVDDDGPPLRTALEAILMVVDEPVSEVLLAQVTERPTDEVLAALRELAADYDESGRGFELRQVAGGWRFYTRATCAPYVERFVLDGQQARLTQAALETLAVVAYRQPVTRARVSAVRGVNVDGVMRTLVARGLVEEAGRDGWATAARSSTAPPPTSWSGSACTASTSCPSWRRSCRTWTPSTRCRRRERSSRASGCSGSSRAPGSAAAGPASGSSRRAGSRSTASVVRVQGMRVDPDTAVIKVDGMRIASAPDLVYLALNKPIGVVSTMSDPEGRPSLADYVADRNARLFHVGRLDADTEGLILLTNDGDLAHRLAHPSYGVEKTYLAEVAGPVARDVGRRLRDGIELEDGVVQADSFQLVEHGREPRDGRGLAARGAQARRTPDAGRGRSPGHAAGAHAGRPDHARHPQAREAPAAQPAGDRRALRRCGAVTGQTAC